MKRYHLLITAPAEIDIITLVDFIALDKPLAAEKFKIRLVKKINTLKSLPYRGHKIRELDETKLAQANYRELSLKPCRIIYRIMDETQKIIILRVLHAKSLFSLN